MGEEKPETVGKRLENPYEATQEARRQRLLGARARAATEAEQLHKRAVAMVSVIPFGQPILVGHHSEGRDRRYRGRIHETYRRSFEAQSQAEQLQQRAASVCARGPKPWKPPSRPPADSRCKGTAGSSRRTATRTGSPIRFEAIPAVEVHARLKGHGFRWSPTRRAWGRMLSNAARAAMGLA